MMGSIGLTARTALFAAGILWLAGLTLGTERHVRECPTGRFGPDCVYACHCHDVRACHPVTGSCGSRGCAKGYVGEGCQYVNLAYNISTGDGISRNLVDGDPLTCVDLDVKRTVRLDLGEPFWLRRINVIASATSKSSILQVGVSNNSEGQEREVMSPHTRITWSDDGEVDVFLREATLGRYVWVRVEKVLACEVYVYGGRNVALFRPTQQSSTYGNMTSSLAVDGMTSRQLSRSCSRTKSRDKVKAFFKEKEVWWRVNLTANYVITRVVIHNHDVNLMRWFHLLAGSVDEDSLTAVYGSNSRLPPSVLDMIPVEPIHLALFQVQLYGRQRVLSLCEVQLFGDCPDMKYGPWCNNTCACADKTEVCDSFSGACASNRTRAPLPVEAGTSETDGAGTVDKEGGSTVTVVVLLLVVVLTLAAVALVVWWRRGKDKDGNTSSYTDAKTNQNTGSQDQDQSDNVYEIVEANGQGLQNSNGTETTSRNNNTPVKRVSRKLAACGHYLLKQKTRLLAGIKDKGQQGDKPVQVGAHGTDSECNSVHDYEDPETLGACATTSGSGSDDKCYECLRAREYETPYTVLGEARADEKS